MEASEWPKVVWMPAGLDGCALWRMFMPHLNFPGSQFLFKFGNINFTEFRGEVVVVQRQVGERNLAALKSLRANGYKIVYDLDDDVWCLPLGNPLKKIFEHVAADFDPCAAEADVITVSTRGLATAVEQKLGYLKKPIVVCPNAVDFRLYHEATVKKDDSVVIGWQGSNTHLSDVMEAWSVLPDILHKYPNVKMEFVGQDPPKEIIGHERVRKRPWVPVGEFPARLASWGWDVALAPLEDVRFNRSKSAIKVMESAVQHVPVLCSDVQPYREFCSLGGNDLKWLLCSGKWQWRTKLETLITDREKRVALGNKARFVVERFFNVKSLVHNWKRACNIALGKAEAA